MNFHLSTEEKWLLAGGAAVVALLVVAHARSSSTSSTSSTAAAAAGTSTAAPGTSVGTLASFETSLTAQQDAFLAQIKSALSGTTTTTTTPTVTSVPPGDQPTPTAVTSPPTLQTAPVAQSQPAPTGIPNGLMALATPKQAVAAAGAGEQLWWIPPGSTTPEPIPLGFTTVPGDRTEYAGWPTAGTATKGA